MYEKRDTSFHLKESKSALKKFAIQYRIDGSNGYDPESFLLNSKCVLDVLILSNPRNHQHFNMNIVNHTKQSKLNFLKRERKFLFEITVGQCGFHLQYMQILNPSHHSCQHVNQTLMRATPNGIRNTPPADFVTT